MKILVPKKNEQAIYQQETANSVISPNQKDPHDDDPREYAREEGNRGLD
jgi:hypothetical protein